MKSVYSRTGPTAGNTALIIHEKLQTRGAVDDGSMELGELK